MGFMYDYVKNKLFKLIFFPHKNIMAHGFERKYEKYQIKINNLSGGVANCIKNTQVVACESILQNKQSKDETEQENFKVTMKSTSDNSPLRVYGVFPNKLDYPIDDPNDITDTDNYVLKYLKNCGKVIYKLPILDSAKNLRNVWGNLSNTFLGIDKFDKGDFCLVEKEYEKYIQNAGNNIVWDVSGEWGCGIIDRGAGTILQENFILLGYKIKEDGYRNINSCKKI